MFDRRRPDPQQGIIETLLILDGRPVELDAHLARLRTSLEEVYPNHPHPDPGELDVPSFRGPYRSLSDGTSGLGALRITVAPNCDNELEARIVTREVARELVFSTSPTALHSLPLAGGLGDHKWADRSLLEEAQTQLPAGALPLIIDGDGTVLEASRANVFAVRGGALLTPPLDGRILPGVTRARVLEIAGARDVEPREEPLTRSDLHSAEEVFLTGSVRGVEKVSSLDGTALSASGEVAGAIAAELRRSWSGAAQVG